MTDASSGASDVSDVEIVAARLRAAGLPASAQEISALAAGWGAHLAGVASLYAIAETRYVTPALHFDPVAEAVEWGTD